jgi:TrwC relaxase
MAGTLNCYAYQERSRPKNSNHYDNASTRKLASFSGSAKAPIASPPMEPSKARSLYDTIFSAPKSIYFMAIVAGDERLIAAHETTVRETLQEAEKYSQTRVRLAGLNENRTTGNWFVAAYTHDTSRELDPQLHTHAVAASLTYDGTEVRWKALQASGLYERRSYLTEVYRNALSREVPALGWILTSFSATRQLLSRALLLRHSCRETDLTCKRLVFWHVFGTLNAPAARLKANPKKKSEKLELWRTSTPHCFQGRRAHLLVWKVRFWTEWAENQSQN